MPEPGKPVAPGYSIRQLTPQDWPIYKAVRLEALLRDPHSFGSNYERERVRTDVDWQARLAEPRFGIFALFCGDEAVGMTGIAIMADDAEGLSAVLWGSWIEKSHRGKGLSDLLYKARIGWAKAHPTVEKIIVSHYDYNGVSRRSNQRHGFVYTHSALNHAKTPPATELFYELRVKPAKPQPASGANPAREPPGASGSA